MKKLLLLRHADALPAEGGNDIERKLSPKGLKDAYALGEELNKKNLIPMRIACSSAKRTQQTCQEVLKGCGENIHTEFSKMIYGASTGDLLNLIRNTDDTLQSLMIIGHNPTIYELAVHLAMRGNDMILNHLGQGYAPATLSVLDINIQQWAEINPEHCEITALLDPLNYNAPATPARWT